MVMADLVTPEVFARGEDLAQFAPVINCLWRLATIAAIRKPGSKVPILVQHELAYQKDVEEDKEHHAMLNNIASAVHHSLMMLLVIILCLAVRRNLCARRCRI